jgi:hypothetical protein
MSAISVSATPTRDRFAGTVTVCFVRDAARTRDRPPILTIQVLA